MRLRIVIGLLTLCFFAAGANYYLGFGLFGAYARLVFTALMLVLLVALGVVASQPRAPDE
jgi:uncharacterized membrane protein